jgi:ankyrin repeat protein
MILDRRQFAHRLFNIILHNGDIIDIKILLLKSSRMNIDLNCLQYNGQSLIHFCCLHNRLDLLQLFIEYGNCDLFTINRDGWLPLHVAVYLGHMSIVKYLLERFKSN